MQYDNPVSSEQLQSHLDASTLSSSTVAAISSLLGLGEGTTVNVANFDGVNLELPTDGTANIVTGVVAGAKGDQVVVDLSAGQAAGANTFLLESDANLVVNVPAAAPVQAFAAFAAEASTAVQPELILATGNGDDVITVQGDQNVHIDAGDGNDTIITGNGNNTVIAGAGNNNVKTGSGSDTVILSGSNHADVVDTGAGFDVVQLDGSRADYNFAVGSNFSVNLTGNQTALISNAELLTFVNGDAVETVALAHSESEALALRLYQGILGRDVDQDGAKFFVDQVNAGSSLTDIANQFLTSNEFAGAANQASINELYNSLLGRNADEAGSDLYKDYLANGGSLTDVAAFIATSEEAQARDQSNGDFVRDLYTNVLGRDAEEEGLNTWVSALFNGTSRADVAKYIVGSEEAAQKSTSEFIDALYNSALGREAEEAGKAFWTAQLEGGSSHADVALSIIGSTEAADAINNVVVLHGQV